MTPIMLHLVLHPQYKTEYFKKANWEPEWIRTAEEILRKQFELHYQKESNAEGKPQADGSSDEMVRNLF
jgi:hypothetical protein